MSTATASASSFSIKPWIELSRVDRLAGSMLIFWPLGGCRCRMHFHPTPTPPAPISLGPHHGGTNNLDVIARLHSSSCIWAARLSPPSQCVEPVTVTTFGVSADLPSGAGCIWNDILDRNFDRQVGKYRCTFALAHGTD
ncbi:hypothetical protein BV25DRAFT_1585178 [Artomyces pyxidatus]|uniref:Uncharacterized protein n=1 Tax=Artomyces pyxidatus TaxID=48021 RepID=A0ACB8TBY1_9AGAM|nr:hypothetical protein BV25DRAFT_1585178 [Artomyces pyxidatus]